MPKNDSDNRLAKLGVQGPDSDDYQRRFKLLVAQIVEEQVQQAMTQQQEAIFQPFFQSKTISNEIRRRQTVPEQEKWTHYFKEWGCLVCETKKKGHTSLGMCNACFSRIAKRLGAIIHAHTPAPEDQPTFMDTVRLARQALEPSIEILKGEKNDRQE